MEKTVKNKKIKLAVTVIVAVIVLAVAVFAGFVIREFSLPDEVSTYKWALNIIEKNYCGEYNKNANITVPNEGYTAEQVSLKALAGTLDIYSEYYTAEEYRATNSDNAGRKSGIGVNTNFVKGKGIIVVSVVYNSPAFISGIRAGDMITGGQAGSQSAEFASSKDFTDFISARATGEEFTLSALRGSFKLSKEVYTASYTAMYTANMEYGYTGGNGGLSIYNKLSDEMKFLPEYTAYVRINQFYGGVGSQFAGLINAFNANEKTDTLIIDLRNDGGGYVSAMQSVAGCFPQANGKIAMTANYKNGEVEKYYSTRQAEKNRLKAETTVYVLANLNTASASEALIGVLVSYNILDYHNIFISQLSDEYMKWAGLESDMGTAKTYGKGIMQSTFVRPRTGEALKLTTAKIHWPNGNCIHGVGIDAQKDGCRAIPAEWTATEGDSELKSAVQQIINDRAN